MARPAGNIRRRFLGGQLYLVAGCVVATCVLLGWFGQSLGLRETNLIMIFLAGVSLVAARCGRGPAIAASLLGMVSFNFFFVQPIFGFAHTDSQYVVTLSFMLGISILISELLSRLERQLQQSRRQEHQTAELFHASQERERRTAQLYQMTRQLSRLAGTDLILATAGRLLAEFFGGDVELYLVGSEGRLEWWPGGSSQPASQAAHLAAQQVIETGQSARPAPGSAALYVPMIGTQRRLGVVGVTPGGFDKFLDVEERRMLETCANLVALSIERDRSVVEAQAAQVQVQSEQLRNALLSSVSHELRTPLATIAVTAASLVEHCQPDASPAKREMLQTVVEESHRLARQVDNLLDMARLDAGTIALDRDWQVLEELVGVALGRLRRELADREVQVHIPGDFPLLIRRPRAAGAIARELARERGPLHARWQPNRDCRSARRRAGRDSRGRYGSGFAAGKRTTGL